MLEDTSNVTLRKPLTTEHPIVVCSHGFGVQRDSRGMFTVIVDTLPKEWGYVLFDYNDMELIDGVTHTYLRPYSEQASRLKKMLVIASKETKHVYAIGHSMGCVTLSILGDERVEKSILLAPPVASSSGRTYFGEYPGASRDENNILVIPRKDGTITHVPDSFWDQAEAIFPPEVYVDYANKTDLSVVQAKSEDVLKHLENYETLKQHLRVIELAGDHNFSGEDLVPMAKTCLSLLA